MHAWINNTIGLEMPQHNVQLVYIYIGKTYKRTSSIRPDGYRNIQRHTLNVNASVDLHVM